MPHEYPHKPWRRRKRRRPAQRRWCLPPAVTREPGETLEGMHVLDEFPAELALSLWTALRDVTLWAATPEERRAGLFSPGAEEKRREHAGATRADPSLDLALSTLSSVVSHSAQATPGVVSLVCMEVSRWARERGGMGTAVAFAQAAAQVAPDDPEPALAVGLLAHEWGRADRAETWLRLAVGLARRARDWERFGRAWLTLGEIYLESGRPQAAERYFTSAARVARRHGLRYLRAEALHGMMRVGMAAGELEEAERFAGMAQRAYGRGHPGAARLLHDWTHLMVRRGEYERAIPLLRRQLAAAADPATAMSCHALLAHAAAGVGDARTYERSWKEAWALRDRPRAAAAVPETLRHLGKAAAHAGDWLRVQQTVRALHDLRAEARAPLAADLAELSALVERR